MPELLLELFCEEIPARMQARAEADLQKALLEGLKAAGLAGSKVESMSGPRRLTVCIEGLPARSADTREERKGPKTGAPEQAVAGFLRGAGLSDISQAEVRSDPKKGDFYVAVKEVSGRATADIVAELVPEIMAKFHWPKSMRTGTGSLRWVRPLQRILCVFDGKTVAFEVGEIASGDLTEGHRVHGRGPFKVASLADYVGALGGDGHVMLTRADRRAKIEKDARAVCKKAGLELVDDAGLLEELVGLAEWPQVILGDMDARFLELPPEVIQLSMRTHQKYFSVRDPKTGKLAPHFVVVANIEASDGGAQIAAGNRKVLSARLEDGRFFWDNDRKTGLEVMATRLGKIDFKKELGTIADKVERVAALVRELAPKVGADPDLAEKAARLCKADLVSEMVYEFPELQGVMGRYYALEQIETVIPAGAKRKAGTQNANPEAGSRISSNELSGMTNWAEGLSETDIRTVADAIADHYKPQGPSDAVPSDPVAIAVALADKLDTLVGFWAIDEKPTGSKDPFALRRAALGVVRIVLENGVRIGLEELTQWQFDNLRFDVFLSSTRIKADRVGLDGEWQENPFPDSGLVTGDLKFSGFRAAHALAVEVAAKGNDDWFAETGMYDSLPIELFVDDQHVLEEHGPLRLIDGKVRYYELSCLERTAFDLVFPADLLSFFADRLKQYLKDQGQRHDLIDAVFALGEDDLVLIVKRVEALGAFLETEDGVNLLAGYKRAANILKAEEKKGWQSGAKIDARLIAKGPGEEQALYAALGEVESGLAAKLEAEDFVAAMGLLASLRGPVDAFFEGVKVNDDDAGVRENRLALLNSVRGAVNRVADFGKIEG